VSILLAVVIVLSVVASFFFSTLSYSLRDYSRARLGDYLAIHGKSRLLDPIVEHTHDLVFISAMGRLVMNVVILLATLRAFEGVGEHWFSQYLWATTITVVITLFCSVAIPHAISDHAAEAIIGVFGGFLLGLRLVLTPFTKVMHWVDRMVGRLAGASKVAEPQQIEQEILDVVNQGQKEGIVDQQEKEMIESVIEFRDTQVGQIMTARPEIVALELHATLQEVKRTLEESGHSRLPVYDGTLDHIVGILYARDLLKHLGQPPEQFNVRSAIRPAVFVPEIKPLRDLLKEFRQQKVHIAIVADEYGGTAGLVTIEDILEELVGEISDEHEPIEPSMFRRLDDRTADVDARMYIGDVNRLLGLDLPDDAGYETLGGFISVQMGRIPPEGATFEHEGVRYTITSAEPQKVNRVKIELPGPKAATAPTTAAPAPSARP
jgi:CBS domain containing-hemolysin-like protein